MEDIRELLDLKLLSQTLSSGSDDTLSLEKARHITNVYTGLEGGISVLSDMRARKSYVYYGHLANLLGLQKKEFIINSIWEDELLELIHIEDLKKKYALELRFFKLLNTMDAQSRLGYEVITKLRARGKDGKKFLLKHRLIYINSSENGNIWLALCLYNIIVEYPGFDAPDGVIINTNSGTVVESRQEKPSTILTIREQDILKLIKSGYRSKDIAQKTAISIHTVSRHRQNIFIKLNVTNSMEACRIAEAIGII